MSQLFQRQCVAIVGDLKMTDLRMTFKVTKNSNAHPNTCELSISNLNQDSRSRVQKRYAPLILQAGYAETVATIFSGKVRNADHVVEGPTTTSLIHSGDGEVEYGFATISKSYAQGIPASVVLNDLLDNFTDPTTGKALDPGISKQLFAGLTKTFGKGFVSHGRVATIFDQVVKSLGFEWSIQDGRVQVLQEGGSTTEQVIHLSPDSGLIGSPQHGTGDGKVPQKNAATIKFKSLLQPGLKPGRLVSLQSKGVTGVLRIVKVEHRGDTFGGDWVSEVEALPAPNAKVVG